MRSSWICACAALLLGCSDDSANRPPPTPTAAATPASSASASLKQAAKDSSAKDLRSVGMKRYRRAKAIAEMKKQLGDVARAVAVAYERSGEGKNAALCGSAQPVPAELPSWEKPYQPKKDEGADFQTGDDKTGWKCIAHTPESAMRFQLSYTQGVKYKSVARGGDDPGPKGFEVAAEFDSNGNGRTALFAMTGKVGDDGKLTISKDVFEADKEE